MIMSIVPPKICQASWRNVNAMTKKKLSARPQAPISIPIPRNELLQVCILMKCIRLRISGVLNWFIMINTLWSLTMRIYWSVRVRLIWKKNLRRVFKYSIFICPAWHPSQHELFFTWVCISLCKMLWCLFAHAKFMHEWQSKQVNTQ